MGLNTKTSMKMDFSIEEFRPLSQWKEETMQSHRYEHNKMQIK